VVVVVVVEPAALAEEEDDDDAAAELRPSEEALNTASPACTGVSDICCGSGKAAVFVLRCTLRAGEPARPRAGDLERV
jgi:hypothetical protein